MLSPRAKPEAGAEGDATPDRPAMTPRGTSLLGSLGKLLWSPSGGADTPGLKSPAPGGGDDGMMTQASPRQPGTPRSPGPNQASSSSGEAGAPTPGGAEKKGLLDTLFSPVFTLFSGGATKADEKSAAPAAPPPPPPPPKPAPAPAPAPAADDDDVDEFDPYTFIRSLPPTAPAAALARPVCLPKKTRGTHPVSLILDLDETLLHSSIVPLPTYDIVFPVHFNSVNYQARARLAAAPRARETPPASPRAAGLRAQAPSHGLLHEQSLAVVRDYCVHGVAKGASRAVGLAPSPPPCRPHLAAPSLHKSAAPQMLRLRCRCTPTNC